MSADPNKPLPYVLEKYLECRREKLRRQIEAFQREFAAAYRKAVQRFCERLTAEERAGRLPSQKECNPYILGLLGRQKIEEYLPHALRTHTWVFEVRGQDELIEQDPSTREWRAKDENPLRNPDRHIDWLLRKWELKQRQYLHLLAGLVPMVVASLTLLFAWWAACAPALS